MLPAFVVTSATVGLSMNRELTSTKLVNSTDYDDQTRQQLANCEHVLNADKQLHTHKVDVRQQGCKYANIKMLQSVPPHSRHYLNIIKDSLFGNQTTASPMPPQDKKKL